MKFILAAITFTTLGTLAYSLTESATETPALSASSNLALAFSSDDGQATVMLLSEGLFPEASPGESPRTYRLIGSYIDPQFGMIGSSLKSFGTYQNMGTKAALPTDLVLDLGDLQFSAIAIGGDWAKVQSESDVVATFAPAMAK